MFEWGLAMTTVVTPFHAGELEAQRRAGVGRLADSAGSFIHDHMPDQHRDFSSRLPFVVIAAGDGRGRPWVTLLEGEEGFIESLEPRTLTVASGWISGIRWFRHWIPSPRSACWEWSWQRGGETGSTV